MSYFTAVLARAGRGWKARDVEVDDVHSLDDLVEALRSVAVNDQPVLAVVEHEDEWFALVRVDGEEEPRIFVSDLAAASKSHYGDVLAAAGDVDVDDDEDDVGGDDDKASDDEDDDAPVGDAITVAVWAGEPDLLEDLGVSGRTLRKLVEEKGDDPGAILADVGETVGFADLLEALR